MYYLTRESIGTEKTGVCVPLVITCAIRAYAFKYDDFLVHVDKKIQIVRMQSFMRFTFINEVPS